MNFFKSTSWKGQWWWRLRARYGTGSAHSRSKILSVWFDRKKAYLTLLFGPPLVLLFELPIPLEPLPELGLRKLVLSRKYKLISMLKPFQMQKTPIFSMNTEWIQKESFKRLRKNKKINKMRNNMILLPNKHM